MPEPVPIASRKRDTVLGNIRFPGGCYACVASLPTPSPCDRRYINLQAGANRPVAYAIPCVRFNDAVSPSFGLQDSLRVHVVNAVPPANFQWVS